MPDQKIPMPEFGLPPVVEVAISLQFAALERLCSAHFGRLWSRFEKIGFTRTEDHHPLDASTEEDTALGALQVGVTVQMIEAVPLPRVWFLNSKENELVQIQRDRITLNWRQGASQEAYPRYGNIILRFREALGIFIDFCDVEGLGELIPNQCEVTYINHVLPGEHWKVHGELDRVVAVWSNENSDDYLSRPEDVGFHARYRMRNELGGFAGRLHVVLQPAYRSTDRVPILVLNLTGRGKPRHPSLDSAYALFDQEHEWIVRGFAALTSKEMHEVWRRKQ